LSLDEIARPDDVRRQNRRLVLATLRRHGLLSRTDIVAQTGLSPSTVSAITTALISEGIIAESRDGDVTANRRGRPQVALTLNPEIATVATVELALNLVHAVLFDYKGQMIAEEARRVPTLDAKSDDLMQAGLCIFPWVYRELPTLQALPCFGRRSRRTVTSLSEKRFRSDTMQRYTLPMIAT